MRQIRAERQTQPDLSAPAGASMLHAGTIVGVYGVRGWVRIRSFTEPQENFLSFERWYIQDRSGRREAVFAEGRRHGKGLIGRIEGVDTREAAEALKGAKVWVRAQELPVLPEEEYYWHQLEGLQVWAGSEDSETADTGQSPEGTAGSAKLYGRVSYLLETGANDVLVVKPCEGSIDTRERLIPYLVGSVVREVDLEAGKILVAWHPED